MTTYDEALDSWRRQLRDAFADPGAADFGDRLVLAAAGVAGFIAAEKKERLRGWARDIKRWDVLPKPERERLVAAGLRYCAVLANEKPVSKPAPPPSARTRVLTPATTREGSLTLGTPLLGLPGVGPATAQKLAERELATVGDVLHFLPRRWDDLRQLVPIGALAVGQMAVTRGTVRKARVAFGRGRRILEVTFVGDDGAELGGRWFHFRGGMMQRFVVGARFLVSGVVRDRKGAREMIHPETIAESPEDDAGVGGAGVRVRYPEVEGVPGRTVEKLCRAVVERFAGEIPDGIPPAIAARHALGSQAEALRALHLPPVDLPEEALRALNDGVSPSQRRLVFDEFFFLQLGLARRRGTARRESGLALPAARDPERALARFAGALPFSQTGAQRRAIAEIAKDLAEPHPMHRLLQGDVGSGKTVVAFAACELAVASGFQAAIMAPTEILAEQHARTLTGWAERRAVRWRC